MEFKSTTSVNSIPVSYTHLDVYKRQIVGCTNDYAQTADSAVVVITSGIPRKPGMTREELIGVNAGIVKSVAENILKFSPNAIIVVVSNPMDTMTYLALKTTGLPKNKIIGMGGALDSARFKCYLSKALNANPNEVEGMVIGGHGDTTTVSYTHLDVYKRQYKCKAFSGFIQTKILIVERLPKMTAGIPNRLSFIFNKNAN